MAEPRSRSKITEITVGCSKTINLGNYQSLKIEAHVTVSVDDERELNAIKIDVQDELRALLEDTYKAQYRHAKGDEFNA